MASDASHSYLMENGGLYRRARGVDLASEALDRDSDLLGRLPKKK